MTAVLLATMLGAGSAPADTIVELRRGEGIVIGSFSGEISIETWQRDALEIREEDGESALVVERSGQAVRVFRDDRKGRRRSVRASIRVPVWADVEVRGRSLDVQSRGLGGDLQVRNIDGDVIVRDSDGGVDISSIEGEIDIANVRGRVSASSQSDDVRVVDAVGPVDVHSGDGDVVLERVRAESVRAETQDGDVYFSGALTDGGRYGFFVHDGDATLALPPSTSAAVSVSTFDGEFEADFPVVVQRFRGGREFEFTLGLGGASLQIQVFDGEIRLLQR